MHKITKEVSSELLSNTIVAGMQEVKAKEITIIDLREVSNAVCDFFVICSGDSSTQVDGISDSIVKHTRELLGEKPWHVEGKNNAEWVLVDYVNVVAHVFYKEARSFYELEDVWADGKRTDIPDID